ncbi:hypothetical protein [Streptosporangium saharense]|uniref:hypothetical protein n=1 Tax=Streptosporangium saharense TaxID=1706840 RepID=UPI00333446AF
MNSNNEWATTRPVLVARIAADTRRTPDEVGRLLDALHGTPPDDIDPAQVVDLLAPTAIALGAAPVADALARIADSPEETRGPAMAQLVRTLAPAVTQAVLGAEGARRADL